MSNELIPLNEFQTAVPSNEGVLTVRSTNTESPSNNDLINVYDLSTNTIPDNLVLEYLPSDHTLIFPNTTTSKLPVIVYVQDTCFKNLESDFLITSKEDLFLYLCDILIRFDADPLYYQKEDYEALIKTLTGSLVYLYDSSINQGDINNGQLRLVTSNDGITNSTIYVGNGSGFSANSSTNFTYSLKVGPALVNLATLLATPETGFIKKSSVDNYELWTTPLDNYEQWKLRIVQGDNYAESSLFNIQSNRILELKAHPSIELYGEQVNETVKINLQSVHNNQLGLQGGAANEYYHITNAELLVLRNTSGQNTGDQDLSNYLLKTDVVSTLFIYKNELMLGVVNGINKIFTTSSPFVLGSLLVFVNGLKVRNYTVNSNMQITFDDPPLSDGELDIIEATYVAL